MNPVQVGFDVISKVSKKDKTKFLRAHKWWFDAEVGIWYFGFDPNIGGPSFKCSLDDAVMHQIKVNLIKEAWFT